MWAALQMMLTHPTLACPQDVVHARCMSKTHTTIGCACTALLSLGKLAECCEGAMCRGHTHQSCMPALPYNMFNH